jgi:hypothetical protein
MRKQEKTMKRITIQTLVKKLDAARMEFSKLEHEYEQMRLSILQQVSVGRKGDTFTFTLGNRVIKAKHNSHRRLKVVENGRTLDSDYMGTIRDLQFAMATREI